MADHTLTQTETERLRKAVLRELALRPSLAATAESVWRWTRGEFDPQPSPAEAVAALAFLRDLGLVRSEVEPLGATLYYQVTAAGTLHFERTGR